MDGEGGGGTCNIFSRGDIFSGGIEVFEGGWLRNLQGVTCWKPPPPPEIYYYFFENRRGTKKTDGG